MNRALRLGAALLAAIWASPAPAAPGVGPRFDCARATTPGERGVCADPALAAQDRALSGAYARALAFAGDPAALRAQERAALAVRNACATRACLVDWYGERRAVLAAASVPAPGACTEVVVKSVGPRLESVPGSGSAIAYANGMSQVSYEVLPGIAASQPGDRVRLCLVSRPRHCPAADDRGSVYAARNLRTGARWRAADSQHECGGA